MESSSVPRTVISLSITPSERRRDDGRDSWDYQLLRWAAHVRDGERVKKYTGTTPESFWNRVQTYTSRGRNVWIIAPDASTSFRALNGWILSEAKVVTWGELESGNKRAGKDRAGRPARSPCMMILSPAVTILVHEFAGGRCTWVSVSNYLPHDLPKMAESVGMTYPPDGDGGPHGIAWQRDCKTAAVIIGEFFRRMMTRFKDDDGGHWKSTAAQLSHQTFRRRFYGRDLVEHREPSAAKLDREALYGGRAELLFYGSIGRGIVAPDQWMVKARPCHKATIPGPVHKLDIRSQYPALLRDQVFPVALDRPFGPCSSSRLRALAEYRCIFARVQIETNEPIYPYRMRNVQRTESGYINGQKRVQTDYLGTQVIYPIGRFTTTLAGPELLEACQRGHLKECLGGWEYRPGRPFQKYAEWLISERESARSAGDELTETMRKLQANSFAGKFASRGGGWVVDRSVIPEKRWGEWSSVDLESGEITSYRSISGIVQRFHKDDDEPKGFPSIFAYLTSYGRVQLYRIIEAAGPGGALWCHTDGVMVTAEGLKRLTDAGLIGTGEAGSLHHKGEIHDFAGFGPSHYCADGVWTLAGFQGGIEMRRDGTFAEVVSPGISGLIHGEGSSIVDYTRREKRLPGRPQAGYISADGYWKPRHLQRNEDKRTG